ncbi:MAG: GNAT family N-acetyltransferase [bacterium]
MTVHPLSQEHLPLIPGLQPPGWRDISPNFAFYVSVPFCLPVGVFEGSALIGIGAATRHRRSGWLGHIITHPEHRRRGVGSAIVKHLLDHLRNAGIGTVSLCATEEGYPLYRRFGFVDVATYGFYEIDSPLGPHSASDTLRPAVEVAFSEICELDRATTGEERDELLRLHVREALVVTDSRTDASSLRGAYFPSLGEGLVIARDPEAGRMLLRHRLSDAARCVVPAANSDAIEFLRIHGYRATHEARRMTLGRPIAWNPERVYARVAGNLG